MATHDDNQDLFGGEALPDDALDRMSAPEIRNRWPQALSDMIAVIEAANLRAGDDPDTARRRAYRAVRALAHFAGGRQLYVPQGRNLDRALRDREIFARYTGDNVPELAKHYALSEMYVYSILSEQRELHRRRVQPELFE
ncbi:Mor transcription activator family protein [Salinicola sp. JS01]|uniref:Mor transcription activator family protein n=1 Tax=Salinicola sp. JS01 TaxID=3050071 RepID=UPI00255BE43D|nr:Mor transcription activator family protein [Salinicola sp. JS01]WIX31229.1 Mor transcription activator family protein [Salinicola sp. JS01]